MKMKTAQFMQVLRLSSSLLFMAKAPHSIQLADFCSLICLFALRDISSQSLLNVY